MPRMDQYDIKAAPTVSDQLLIIDVEDGSQSPQGTTKRATLASLPGSGPAADYAPTGLTGATAASRYVGATTSGAPVTGTFLLGDFAVDQTGKIWICTVAGSPGTWTAAGPTIPVTIAQGGTGQTTAAAALGALGGAAVAGDIGGTSAAPQVTATHLAAALPIAQGGTGQATQQAAIDALTGTQSAGKVLRSDGTHATLSAIQAGDLPAIAALTAVAITTTGATFSPKVVLAAGSTATVTWTCPGVTTATGLTPTLSFGSTGTRTVYMTCKDANGYDAMDQIAEFNIGFLNTDDNGKSSLDATHNWTSQAVSGITGIRNMKGLQIFCAANINAGHAGLPDFTGTLDFGGLSQLQYIEIFGSRVTAVYLSGCNSLVRACVENNSLTALDINPAQPNLQDLRSAVMIPAAAQPAIAPLAFTPLAISAKKQWHYCIRDQVVQNIADFSLLPAVEQLWIWNTRQSGQLKTYSTTLSSLHASGNDYNSADLTSQFNANSGVDGTPSLDLAANLLTSVNLTNCTNLLDVQLQDNNLPQAQVDAALAQLDANGQNNGTVYLTGNAAPSAAGIAHGASLASRGWQVQYGQAGSITVVQTAHSTGALPLSFASPVTAGNTVVLIVGGYNTVGGATSSAPTLGGSAVAGSYSAVALTGNGILAGPVGGNYVYAAAWVLPNCPAANGLNLTASGFNFTGVIALEIHGLGAAPTGGGAGATGGHTAIDPTGCAFYAGGQQNIIIGFAQIYAQTASGPPAPWTTLSGQGGAQSPTWAGYRFQTQAQGKSYHWLQTANSDNQPWAAGLFGIHA